jgi:trehalose/maltose transport system substrate-binding protein
MQKRRAIEATNLPTLVVTYGDADVAAKAPIIPRWKEVFQNAVPRPSAPTKVKYNEVSSQFWTAVHKTLSGDGSAKDNLAALEAGLTKLKSAAW